MLDASLLAVDGIELYARRRPPAPGTTRRGSLLLAHGLGEHSGRYGHVVELLAGLGLEVWAYDHRGHGRSGGARGAIPHADALLDDLRLVFGALAEHAAAQGDDDAPFLLGHSMGGTIAARAATGGWVAPRALILSSPALRLRMAAWQEIVLGTLGLFVPNHPSPNGLPLDGLSHDSAIAAAYEADEHNHGVLTPRLAQFIEVAGRAARRAAPRLRVPALVLAGGRDPIVDPAGARAFAAALPDGVGTLRWYDDLLHEIFNEREPDRSVVLDDLRDWITARL